MTERNSRQVFASVSPKRTPTSSPRTYPWVPGFIWKNSPGGATAVTSSAVSFAPSSLSIRCYKSEADAWGCSTASLRDVLLSIFFLSSITTLSAESHDWPQFRGNPNLSGVAEAMPEKVVQLWEYDAAAAIESSAAIVGDKVYIGSLDGTLHCIDLRAGKAVWTTKIKDAGFKASPGVKDGTIYIGDDFGKFHAFKDSDGKEIWNFETEGEIISSANFLGDSILFGSYDAFLYCLNAEGGKLRWKLESDGRVHATPAISAEKTFIAGCDGMLRVIEVKDGKEVGKVELGAYSGCSPALEGSKAYVGTFGNSVLGIDWKEGKKIWEFADQDRGFPFISSAAISNGKVVIGGRDKRIHCFDATSGKVLWQFETKARVESSPVIAGDHVWCGSEDGNLYRINLNTGKEIWKFESGSTITASPSIAHGKLVIGNGDGVIYCFGAK
ncbi:MAG: PQQ-binding-like beta-propeller repeat protein [Planctomycetota bacterium]|nr:PQQ-binding-like beta-propeller repeat protein [Planctomycetota bacterium]MDA1142949.1 PQQ-binding-like beta-propeller repeat protein [Planctomycetota bacterium]